MFGRRVGEVSTFLSSCLSGDQGSNPSHVPRTKARSVSRRFRESRFLVLIPSHPVLENMKGRTLCGELADVSRNEDAAGAEDIDQLVSGAEGRKFSAKPKSLSVRQHAMHPSGCGHGIQVVAPRNFPWRA